MNNQKLCKSSLLQLRQKQGKFFKVTKEKNFKS